MHGLVGMVRYDIVCMVWYSFVMYGMVCVVIKRRDNMALVNNIKRVVCLLSFFTTTFHGKISSFSPGNSQGRNQPKGMLGFLDHYIYEPLRATENKTFEVLPNNSKPGLAGKLLYR
jgi:hypothetical protein